MMQKDIAKVIVFTWRSFCLLTVDIRSRRKLQKWLFSHRRTFCAHKSFALQKNIAEVIVFAWRSFCVLTCHANRRKTSLKWLLTWTRSHADRYVLSPCRSSCRVFKSDCLHWQGRIRIAMASPLLDDPTACSKVIAYIDEDEYGSVCPLSLSALASRLRKWSLSLWSFRFCPACTLFNLTVPASDTKWSLSLTGIVQYWYVFFPYILSQQVYVVRWSLT